MWSGTEPGPTVAGSEGGRRQPQAKENRWLQGAGNGHTWWPARKQRPSPTTRRNYILPTTSVSKDTNCLLEPPGRNAALLIPWFHPARPCWTADLQNRYTVNMYHKLSNLNQWWWWLSQETKRRPFTHCCWVCKPVGALWKPDPAELKISTFNAGVTLTPTHGHMDTHTTMSSASQFVKRKNRTTP